jgi:hypothetical protein
MKRGLRSPVIGRKNFYGTKTMRGAEPPAMLYSIIASCSLSGVEPKAYLRFAYLQSIHHRANTDALPDHPHIYAASLIN